MSTIRTNNNNGFDARLTAEALSSLANQSKTQLDAWLEEPQSHERLAVGKDTSRASKQMICFFKDVDINVKGEEK